VLSLICYVDGDYNDASTFKALKEAQKAGRHEKKALR